MPIRDRGHGGTSGQELKNFTDREDELAIFRRLLDVDDSAQLPALMFFGVGGTGKSWLLQHLRQSLVDRLKLPSAYVDFDRKSGGPSYVSDFSNLLAEIWRQLDVECPRFETAYAWMRFKQGASDRPLARHSGKVSTGWEFVKEGASAGLSSVPGGNLLVWAADKLGKVAIKQFEKTPLGRYLLAQSGEEDYLHLGRLTAQEIYPELTARLGEDLDEQLPKRAGSRRRAVVFLDTFEDVSGGEQNEARRQVTEEPVRELCERLPCVFLVMFGATRWPGTRSIPNGPTGPTWISTPWVASPATTPRLSWGNAASLPGHSWRRSSASRATSQSRIARRIIPSAWACAPTRSRPSGAGATSPGPIRSTWRPVITASWPSGS